jgi:hypothetical protein
MKSWERRHSIKPEEMIQDLNNLPTISQYSSVVVRLVLDKTNENKNIHVKFKSFVIQR